MTTIEKTIKVLRASKEAAWGRKTMYEERGETEKAERSFHEWIAYDRAVAMLTDETQADVHYKVWFGEEATNVDMP